MKGPAIGGRGWVRMVGASLVTLCAVALGPSPVVACSLAGYPGASHVRADARAIVAGTIVAVESRDGALDRWTIDITRVFKGRVAADPLTRTYTASGCGDDLHVYHARVGSTVIIAIGTTDHGRVIDPVWVFRDDGRLWAASVEGGGRTYAEVAATLVGILPPTDLAAPAPAAGDASLPLLATAGAAGAAAFTIRRRVAAHRVEQVVPDALGDEMPVSDAQLPVHRDEQRRLQAVTDPAQTHALHGCRGRTTRPVDAGRCRGAAPGATLVHVLAAPVQPGVPGRDRALSLGPRLTPRASGQGRSSATRRRNSRCGVRTTSTGSPRASAVCQPSGSGTSHAVSTSAAPWRPSAP